MNLKSLVGVKCILCYYYAYVQSRLTYGLIFWGSHASTIGRVFLSQKRVIRTIAGASYLEHCAPIFVRLKIMTVFSLYLFSMSMFVRQNMSRFTTNVSVSSGSINTRNSDRLVVPRHSTTLYERGPHFMGVKVYNALPDCFKVDTTSNKFKQTIKVFFTRHPFYSHNEYFNHRTENCRYCCG